MTNTEIYHKDNANWHYIDLEDFEYKIRQEMTSDAIDCRRRERERKAAEHNKKISRAKYFAIQKLIGLIIVVGTIIVGIMFKGTDMTFSIITLPIGLLLLFSKNKCLVICERNKRMINNTRAQ